MRGWRKLASSWPFSVPRLPSRLWRRTQCGALLTRRPALRSGVYLRSAPPPMPRFCGSLRLLCTVTAVFVLAPPLAAQPSLDPTAPPRHGTLQTSGPLAALDFDIAPEAAIPQAGCPGRFTLGAPDAVVDASGGGTLRIWSRSEIDAVMVVMAPDGTVECSDDVDGIDPAVQIEQASGRYAVWLGAFAETPSLPLVATLYAGAPSPPETTAEVPLITFGDGSDRDIRLGSAYFPSMLGMPETCTGYYDSAASALVTGRPPYTIQASGDADLVMAVRTASGDWQCNDDAFGSDPAVRITEDGQHVVWVGTYRSAARAETPEAVLTTSDAEIPEEAFPGLAGPGGFEQRPFSTGAYTPLDLGARGDLLALESGEDVVERSLDVRGEISNPVVGSACSGMLTPSPTLSARLEGEGPFTLFARADADLVMTVRTASGGWFCSDDASGLNPAVELADGGEVSVWVGTYGDAGAIRATVELHRAPLAEAVPVEVPQDERSVGRYIGNGLDMEAVPQVQFALRDGRAGDIVEAGGSRFNPVVGPACGGYVTPAPTAAVGATGEPLAITVDGDALTLTVLSPDGTWSCSSGDSASARVQPSDDGVYRIWVGTEDRREGGAPAMLRIESGTER